MNKKKLLILLGGLIIVTALITAITLFLLRGSSSYINALPKDAQALARVDIKAVLDKARLTDEETAQLFQRYSLPEEKRTDIGFDLSQPAYAFAAMDGNFGFLAAVADDDALTAWCKSLAANGHASEVTRQRGLSWVVVEQQWLMAFDDDKALAMGPAVGAAQDQLRTVIARLMKQDKDESAQDTELYKLLGTKDEPLVAAVRPELMPDDVLGALSSIKLKSSSQGLYRLTMDADDNELEVDIDIVSDNEDVQAQLKKLNAVMRPLSGELTKNAHADNAIWLAVNTKGDELLKFLRAQPKVRTALFTINLIVDADRIIQAIDGDVAVEFISSKASPSDIRFDFDFKNARLTAQVANTDFLSGASSWGNAFMDVQALSATEYVVKYSLSPIYLGVLDKTFYLGSERGLTTEGNAYLRQQLDDIRGARFFATLNLASIPLEPLSVWTKRYPDLNRLDVRMDEAGEFTFTLNASDTTNILRTLLGL